MDRLLEQGAMDFEVILEQRNIGLGGLKQVLQEALARNGRRYEPDAAQ